MKTRQDSSDVNIVGLCLLIVCMVHIKGMLLSRRETEVIESSKLSSVQWSQQRRNVWLKRRESKDLVTVAQER